MFHQRRSRSGSGDTKLYDIMGISKNADANEIKKAYYKLAIKHHPDKGGDPEKFKEISYAYDILSDPEKKEIYDNYGEEALKEGAGGAGGFHDPFDIFAQFFNGGTSGRRSGPRRGEDVVHPLKVSLEDMYNSHTKKLSLRRSVICSKCAGTGSKSGKSSKCTSCNGQGAKIHVRQIAPGMLQHMEAPCGDCRGSGQVTEESDKCTTCGGGKVVEEQKIVEVFIEKGMRHGEKIILRGEADQAPDTIAGDIVFVLQQKEHARFTRKNADLFYEKEIALSDALCGFSFAIEHLDKRHLLVKSSEGEIVRPGEFRMIDNEGMPIRGSPFDKGRLFIKFSIKFPDNGYITREKKNILMNLLPSGSNCDMQDSDEVDEVTARTVDIKVELDKGQQNFSRNSQAYDDDDDEGDGQKVRCAQQ